MNKTTNDMSAAAPGSSSDVSKMTDFVVPRPKELLVVIAPMTAGKTVLIQKLLAEGRIHPTRVAASTQVADRLDTKYDVGVLYHFNSVIALADALRGRPAVRNSVPELLADFDFRSSLYWRDVLRWPGPKRAAILVTDELTWWRRIASRLDDIPGSGARDYDSDFWLQIAQTLDLAAHYRGIIKGLREEGIEFAAFDSTTADYSAIKDIEAHLRKITLQRSSLTDQDIGEFTRHSGFERGLTAEIRTKNAQRRTRRSDALQFLFKDAKRLRTPELTGKTVLDVQCGWGGACFEAERRGASRVVGLEQSFDRYAAACAMKRILGSRAEFHFGDRASTGLGDGFDFVVKSAGQWNFDRI